MISSVIGQEQLGEPGFMKPVVGKAQAGREVPLFVEHECPCCKRPMPVSKQEWTVEEILAREG